MAPIRRIDLPDDGDPGDPAPKHDMYWIAIDLIVQGIILALVLWFFNGGIDTYVLNIIAWVIASESLVRVFFGSLESWRRHVPVKIGSVLMIIVFSIWLFYEASQTRSGWYRQNVIQDRFSRIISNAPAYALLWNTQGYITEASNNIHILVGYSRDELIGRPITMLLQPRDRPGYERGMAKAVAILRKSGTTDAGWMMQGIVTFGLVHKEGHLVPVKAYSGGIRWSDRVQYRGDTDLFVFFEAAPLPRKFDPTTIDPKAEIQQAPPPPPIKTLVPDEAK